MILTTPRLLLRPWREEDRDAFVALAADPEVMRTWADRWTGLVWVARPPRER